MHFNAPNAFPGLYERRNERLQNKSFFLTAEMGVIHQALQYNTDSIPKSFRGPNFFTKTTRQVVIDAEKFIMRQSHDSMI